jgi:hypothetical protein
MIPVAFGKIEEIEQHILVFSQTFYRFSIFIFVGFYKQAIGY